MAHPLRRILALRLTLAPAVGAVLLLLVSLILPGLHASLPHTHSAPCHIRAVSRSDSHPLHTHRTSDASHHAHTDSADAPPHPAHDDSNDPHAPAHDPDDCLLCLTFHAVHVGVELPRTSSLVLIAEPVSIAPLPPPAPPLPAPLSRRLFSRGPPR